MSRIVVIPTSRAGLVLRQYRLSDALAIFALIDASRPHLSQHGDETARKYPTLLSVEESIRTNNPEARLRLGIWTGTTLVGGINLTPSLESAEVGYWLGAAQCGQGYALCTTEALVTYAHRELGYSVVTARVKVTNGPSLTLLRRADFRFVAHNQKTDEFELQHTLPAR